MYSRFLVKNCIIPHTLTPVSDFSDEQRETNIRPLLQVELGFPNGNGRHRYKSRLVRELLSMEMVVTGTKVALGIMADFGERKENCRFSGMAA